MLFRFKQTHLRKPCAGFTLVEVVISIAVLAIVMAGMIYGYVQTNQRAEWSSMSLAAQSLASSGVAQAIAAKWDTRSSISGTGYGTGDELPPTNYIHTNSMFIPGSSDLVWVTNEISITSVTNNIPNGVPVRQIRADCIWQFKYTGKWFTNTALTWRTSN
jgi:prepilin-type N-terminal cleavage/methylation domain-containing protein